MMLRELIDDLRTRRNEARPQPKTVQELRAGTATSEQKLTVDTALSLASVYRACSIITTAISQLPLYAEKDGTRETESAPAFVKQPNLHMSRGSFVNYLVRSLLYTGNAYFLVDGFVRGSAANLIPLNPYTVAVHTDKAGKIVYSVGDKTYYQDEIGHCVINRAPGELTGRGPLQLAGADILSAVQTRDHAAKIFVGDGTQPGGLLSTDQDDLTAAEIEAWKAAWNGFDPETKEYNATTYNPARIKVIGRGMKYQPLYPDPKSAQWIEARIFDTTTVARLFGIPSSLLLAAMEGSSKTYANVEQEWISLARFTLAEYTQAIEDELSRFSPRGWRVKFNYEGLLRPDTTTRYQSYTMAINAGFLTVNEVRAIEGLPPLGETQ